MLSDYFKEHVGLLVVLILVVLIVAAFVVWLVILFYKQKTKPKEEAPQEAFQEDETSAEAESVEPSLKETEQEEREESEMKKQESEKQEKKAPAAKSAKAQKPAPAPAAKKPKAPQKAQNAGKWELYEEDRGGFGFKLLASNGEVMIKSSSPYASMQSAKAGIKTYQDNIAAGRLEVVETKKGNFFVQVNNASGRMLATSADYPTRAGCESAMQSIKRWAENQNIVLEKDEDK